MFPPPSRAYTAAWYVCPALTATVTLLCGVPPALAFVAIHPMSSVDPEYTASSVSKSLPNVSNWYVPDAGAVHAHQTDRVASTLGFGSPGCMVAPTLDPRTSDRKSTRLNSSHGYN